MFKKGELRLLWPFYTYYLVSGFILLVGAYMVVYFLGLGFTYFQMMSFMAAFSVSTVLLEIPTGAFADSAGRKASVVTGFIIAGIAGLMVPLFSTYWPVLLCMALIGAGVAFMSGAEDAWVVDNLRAKRRKDLQKSFFVHAQAVSAVSMLVVPILGVGLTARFGLVSVWYAFGIAFLLCASFLWSAVPEYYTPKAHWTRALRTSYSSSRAALVYVRKDRVLFPLVAGGILFTLIYAGEDGWQPFLVMQGLPPSSLGYLFAALGATGLLVPVFTPALERLGTCNALLTLTGLAMLAVGAVILLPAGALALSITLFLIIRTMHSLAYPITADIMHTAVPSRMRATVGSMRSMVTSVILAVMLLPLGYAMDLYGPQWIIALCALFGIGALVILARLPDEKAGSQVKRKSAQARI